VGPDQTLMAGAMSSGRPTDLPRKLFEHDNLRGRGTLYDVTPDGQRFVVVKTIHKGVPVIRVVQNWLAGTGQGKNK